MAFSPWQMLSPVVWAKWTWSAVRGGGAQGEEEEEQQDSGSDSEGHFDTPEADTPVSSPMKESSPESNQEFPGDDHSDFFKETRRLIETDPKKEQEDSYDFNVANSDSDTANFNTLSGTDVVNILGTPESFSGNSMVQQQEKISTETSFMETDANSNPCLFIHTKNVNEKNVKLSNTEEMKINKHDDKNNCKNNETFTPFKNPSPVKKEFDRDENGDYIKNVTQGKLQAMDKKVASRNLTENVDTNEQMSNPFIGKLDFSQTPPVVSCVLNKEQFAESNSDINDPKPREESRAARSSPKISRSHLITSSCKLQNFEESSLLDVSIQKKGLNYWTESTSNIGLIGLFKLTEEQIMNSIADPAILCS
ncbi:uncharacterized protein O3C94_008461 [Discoglossus pictus]